MDLQSEQEELLGRDKCTASCAQEVHQVALTEEEKCIRTNGTGVPGDFVTHKGCSTWHLSNSAAIWGFCPQI